jgi:hypothetical protein
MNRPDPDWYADLKGEPLRVRMFTPELAARIHEKAVRKAAMSEAPLSRRALVFGALAGCLAAIMLLAVQQNLLPWPGLAVDNSSVEMGVHTSTAGGGRDAATETNDAGTANEPEHVETDSASSETGSPFRSEIPTLRVEDPTLTEWQTLLDVSYPELQTEILHMESVGDGRQIVLSRNITVIDDVLHGVLAANKFVWKGDGWQRSGLSAYTDQINMKDTEFQVITRGWSIGANEQYIDGFMGFVLDPAITRVHVRDHLGNVHEAKLFPEAEGVTTWFVITPEPSRRQYVVEGLDENGNVVYGESISLRSMKHDLGKGSSSTLVP